MCPPKNKTNSSFKCISLLNYVENNKIILVLKMFQSLKSVCRKQKSTVTNCHYNNTSFYKPIYLPFWYFSIWLPSYCLIFFIFTLQDSLDHILKDRSSGHKLLRLCLSWKSQFFLLSFEGQFCWILSILGWQFPSFSTLIIYPPSAFWPPIFLKRICW